MSICIIGSQGFIGSHLYSGLRALGHQAVMAANRRETENPAVLQQLFQQSDLIIDCAGESRSDDMQRLYEANGRLACQIVDALKITRGRKQLVFVSTTHHRPTLYHQSKEENCSLFQQWAAESGNLFTVVYTPNLFGPYSRPFFNSVVSTFAYMAAHGQTPERMDDVALELVYIREFRRCIYALIAEAAPAPEVTVPVGYRLRLPELWQRLKRLAIPGTLPEDQLDMDLSETLESYR